MACRTYGPGRLAPVDDIAEYVARLLERPKDLHGTKVLITAGPTVEDIDPVRFISNRSSGKMGFAFAQAAKERGAKVTLISGPSDLEFPDVVKVRSTEEMRRAVMDRFQDADVIIKAAAPLDFRPKSVRSEKIKKPDGLDIEFESTPDILKELGGLKAGRILVGFAAETTDHIANARQKLKAKNLDLIVVNPVGGPDSGFDSDMNKATVIDRSGAAEDIPLVTKREMADRILNRVVTLLQKHER
jgi:phosphopantothenoylcysteine decarboxylase/phosphopantothenate--cysteine ligase